MSRPANPVPVGDPTPADRARACDRLSQVHGRRVSGGWAVDELAAESPYGLQTIGHGWTKRRALARLGRHLYEVGR